MFNVYPCLQRLIYTYITFCCDQVASFGTWSQGLWFHRLKLPVFNSLLLVSLGHDVGISFAYDHRCFGFQRRPWVTMQEARCVGGQTKRLVYTHFISSNLFMAPGLQMTSMPDDSDEQTSLVEEQTAWYQPFSNPVGFSYGLQIGATLINA